MIDAAALGTCPVPAGRYDHILLGHGSGGRLTNDLIRTVFLPAFGNTVLNALEDQAIVDVSSTRLAFTTDSFVVQPIFFPGGDIGQLAVNGTVNDLAVGGARPLFLSAAFILEEGLPISDLARIVASMREACRIAGVTLVTGDTKVVGRGKGDQIFITTTGVGSVSNDIHLSISSARPGDCIIVSGTMGDHGIAIMSLREGIEFETQLTSDCASLADLCQMMLRECPQIRCMRDPTRGGLAGVLNELATASNVGVKVDEVAIPVRQEVKSACEMLGLDPLFVANEGKLVAVVPTDYSAALLRAMQAHPLGKNASIVGQVVAEHPGIVALKSVVGGERIVMLLSGEQLPRIC